MTSQYPTKSTTALKPPPAANMRINATTPYQAAAQQQLHQQQQPSSLSQRHHPQQQLQQHQLNNALQQPTSQVSTQTIAAYSNTNSQMQGAFNNNAQQQQISWPTQQNSNYFPSPKNMQPTPPPPINTTTATSTGSANNWPQQTPQQHLQENYQNVNMFPQNVPLPQQQQQQQWPSNTAPSTAYDNFYQQQTVNNNNLYPQQQQQLSQAQQHVAQQNPSNYFQQHPPQTAQTNAVNFFDHTLNNNNNQAENVDGWGDWDWNDNTSVPAQPLTEQVAETNKPALQQTTYSTSILADSFNTQNNNDSWNWDGKENDQQVSNKEITKLDNTPKQAPQIGNVQWSKQTNDKDNQQQQVPPPQPLLNDKQHENWNWQQTALNENQQQFNLAQNMPEINTANAKPLQMESSPPPPPPPLEFSSVTPENHNYNTNASATTSPNNIPNTVFVTQAKPVTLPSRQYASPPGGNTPVIENPPEAALMPPQGFQNVEDNKATAAAVLPPPAAIATTSVANLPPPTGLPIASAKTGNPFKRSGVAQHHRATGLVASSAAQETTVFQMPPPPPADFANPGSVSAMEPENNELPAQENQEVLLPNNTQITLPSANLQPAAAVTQGPPAPPPPNDERNQYLQTSHLSENSEEQQPEIDGLLPPPGLSRLVLGEPELEASQQRLVMGTEASNVDNAVTQAAVMHLEERHADGEDTASENAVPVTISSGQGVPSTSSTLSSDRNLYMVPGESTNAHNSNQQRVVTGVEVAEQREIEMDGENLEDEQQQHQQQHAQHQHAHSTLSAEARNEPPVEGADDTASATGPTITSNNVAHTTDHQEIEQHHHSSNQLTKLKDSNVISSPNDDDDSDDRLLNDRGINQSSAGSLKSKTLYGGDRVISSRRRDKRSSIDHYESDEYLNSEGEYSSEREERERRERDRRRNYREGSVRSDRGNNEDDEKRSRRLRAVNKRDKYYYDEEERNRGGRDERERERIVERSKPDRRSQRQRGYDNDSRYETEESTRFDSRKEPLRRSTRRNERIEQPAEFDDYNRRGAYRSSKRPVDNYESDRRDRRRSDKHREPRYREDPRFDPREYEDYRKHSSRNARESDMEKDPGAAPSSRSGRMHHDPRHAAAMYGYPSGGYYDPYTAYYYQQMARTNPQAYAEWYKKYYGQAAAAGVNQIGGVQGAPNADTSLTTSVNDGRESVHSGRSSAHNDIKDRSGAVSVRDQDALAQEPQRLTPCKFITEHTVVNFASGILVTVKPKFTSNGSVSNIVKLLKFKPNDETRKLFKVFPGPLVRGLTHKKTVIEFCQEQIRLGPLETTIYAKQLITNNAEKYRGSYTLMWNLLILLLKQNGMVVGTDIAELLLKNQQQFPYQTSTTTAHNSTDSKSDSNSHWEELNANKESLELTKVAEALPEDNVNNPAEDNDLDDNSLTKSSSNSITLNEEEITEKFRNYLLYGNVNEALEWATDNNLWGHALFLASKLDRRSHANVMMKFANKLSLNDPLQTLYQLMSGRSPSSVTCVQDEKWGDWRPHLSMILSNTSQKPDLDRKAITTLGDSLFNRGDLYAAHFCYLMAQVGFGRYQETAVQETSLQQHLPKLVLLGSSHYKHFKDFAHNEAIIMTEIYEYACSLNDDKFSLVEFQPYKFLLATRLLDYGFHLKSLMYLEQIAVHISRDVNKYESSFINKVYELADRLKYYDPALEKTLDDQQAGSDDNAGQGEANQQMEEQKWLQNLRHLAEQYKSVFNVATTLPTATDAQDSQQTQLQEPLYYNQQQQIDQQFMEINKQFSELNLQYQQTQPTMENVVEQPNQFYNTEQQQQQQLDPYQQQHQQAVQTISTELPQQSATDSSLAENLTENHQQQSPTQYMQPELIQNATGFAANYYDPSQYNNEAASLQSNVDNQQQQHTNYDYWSQQQQQPLLNQTEPENSRPTISMPKTKTYDTDEDNSTKNLPPQPQTGKEANKKQQQQNQQQKGNKKEDAHKNQQQGNQNSGWFGGIWNKFSLKPKNQMILPDDKNPSIVWDAEKKKWVNTDGDEDEQEAFKPPPKLSDLMPQTQLPQQQQQQSLMFNQLQQSQQEILTNPIPFIDPQQQQPQPELPQMQQQQFVPNTIAPSAPSPNLQQQQQHLNQNQPQAPGPAKTPTLQSNMFKMQRNRTLKNAYVDVFNPSGAPVNKAVENILAPALPPAVIPQSGYFIPGGGTQAPEQQYQQQQQQTQQQSTPQFYNPNQFTSGTGY